MKWRVGECSGVAFLGRGGRWRGLFGWGVGYIANKLAVGLGAKKNYFNGDFTHISIGHFRSAKPIY